MDHTAFATLSLQMLAVPHSSFPPSAFGSAKCCTQCCAQKASSMQKPAARIQAKHFLQWNAEFQHLPCVDPNQPASDRSIAWRLSQHYDTTSSGLRIYLVPLPISASSHACYCLARQNVGDQSLRAPL